MVSNTDLEQDIENLAVLVEQEDKNAASRLRSLKDAVTGGTQADLWATSDIRQTIDPDAIVGRFKGRPRTNRFLDILEGFRNALVITPLLVTWYSISQAVTKYDQLIGILTSQHDDRSSLPFLYLWQHQFSVDVGGVPTPRDPLPWYLTLSSLAFADFFLLLLVLLLTIAVYWGSNFRNNKKEHDTEQLRADLQDAIANASFYLLDKRRQQPGNFAVLAGQLIQQLDEERKRISELATRREKELGDLTTFTSSLVQVSQQMLTAAQTIDQTTGGLTQSINGLAGPAQEISKQQKLLLEAARESIKGLDTVAKVVKDGMEDVSETVVTQLQNLSGTLVTQLQNVNGTLVTQMQAVNGSLVAMVKHQEDWGKIFIEALSRLQITLSELVKTSSDIGQVAKEQNLFLQELKKEHQLQGNIASQVSSAATSMGTFLSELHKCEVDLRSLSKDLYDIRIAFTDMPKKISSELASSLQSFSGAGVTLYNSAGIINHVSQALARSAALLEQRLNGVK